MLLKLTGTVAVTKSSPLLTSHRSLTVYLTSRDFYLQEWGGGNGKISINIFSTWKHKIWYYHFLQPQEN